MATKSRADSRGEFAATWGGGREGGGEKKRKSQRLPFCVVLQRTRIDDKTPSRRCCCAVRFETMTHLRQLRSGGVRLIHRGRHDGGDGRHRAECRARRRRATVRHGHRVIVSVHRRSPDRDGGGTTSCDRATSSSRRGRDANGVGNHQGVNHDA